MRIVLVQYGRGMPVCARMWQVAVSAATSPHFATNGAAPRVKIESASARQGNHRPQAAPGLVLQAHLAPVRADAGACDGKPQPGAAVRPVARRVEPHEGLEHMLELVGRNARSLVLPLDQHPPPRRPPPPPPP